MSSLADPVWTARFLTRRPHDDSRRWGESGSDADTGLRRRKVQRCRVDIPFVKREEDELDVTESGLHHTAHGVATPATDTNHLHDISRFF